MLQSCLSRCVLRTTRSTILNNTSTTYHRSISSAKLTISPIPTDSPQNHMPQNKQDLQFGKVFSSHMLQIPYKESSGGWQSPEIVPYHDLKISPAASSLHYGERLIDRLIILSSSPYFLICCANIAAANWFFIPCRSVCSSISSL